MNIEIWSDVVCPWCYIGKRRLEKAIADFDHRHTVGVTWRSFELNPESPRRESVALEETLAQKYGMTREQARAANERVTGLAAAEGLEYHLENAHGANTFDAHRLIHLASAKGLQGEMKERLMRAHFTEGVAVGVPTELVRLAAEVGIDEADAGDLLKSDRYSDEVRADEQRARELGVSGVPFFVVNAKWGISGAQPTEVFAEALNRIWAELHPTPT